MIHPTAIISSKATLGENVNVGPFTIIHDNVVIEDGCIIGSHCELGIETNLSDGSPLILRKNSTIRSHSVFYESSSFGEGLVTGHRVTVRELVSAGNNLQIGSLSDIQGHCSIGDYVRFHSNVHIGQKSRIGDYVWIFPYVVLTNDPHPPSNVLQGCEIGRYSVIATMSVVLPGVVLGEGVLVAANTLVNKDVESDLIVIGNPSSIIGATSKIKHSDTDVGSAYPWRRHFHRGYPDESVKEWLKEFD